MTHIKKITDKQGNDIYLRTHTKAVVDDNGYTAESRLQAMQDEINQAQLEVGAVPSDLSPTKDSTNWVTSGGIYNELYTQLQGEMLISKKITSTGSVEDATTATNRTLKIDVSNIKGINILANGVNYAGNGTYCWWAIYSANGVLIDKSEVSSSQKIINKNVSIKIPESAKFLYIQGSESDTYILPSACIRYSTNTWSSLLELISKVKDIELKTIVGNIIAPIQKLRKVILNSTGKWGNVNFDGTYVYKVEAGDSYLIKANSEHTAYIHLLTQVEDLTIPPSYMAGTQRIIFNPNESRIINVPDSGYMAVIANFAGYDSTPLAFLPTYIKTVTSFTEYLNITNIKRIQIIPGALRILNGEVTNFNSYCLDYGHTPRLYKARTIKILTSVSGYICYYDSSFNYVGNVNIEPNTTQSPIYSAAYFALTLNTNGGTVIIPDQIEIESNWEEGDELFFPRSIDDGYTPFVFPVEIPSMVRTSLSESELTQFVVRTSDHAMLHLPPSYSATGVPTKLIIYLHGAAERYDDNSTRFGNNVRYSPEWSASNFAQLDVDMIPNIYSSSIVSTAGTGDDADCVFAAYRFVIEHYNIDRNGVYLFGRSRGGQAVLECLAHYNPSKMPIIAALSNAGANTTLIYSIFTATMDDTRWQFFANAMGLPNNNRPTISTTNKRLVTIPSVVEYLRNNIDIWWKKACVAFALMTENNTDYQTPIEIFDFICDSYQNDNARRYSDWVKQLKFHSPVPLRFDWCNGDTIQDWTTTSPYNYSVCVKDAFVNWDVNSEYRFWPQALDSNKDSHYHEDVNFYNGDYMLPNKNIITNPSMAQTEWMLWAMSKDSRFNGCNAL